MMGENRKAVNAILRKVAKKAERAKKRPVTCQVCAAHIEQGWSYCAACGAFIEWMIRSGSDPSYADPPFACPPDEEAK